MKAGKLTPNFSVSDIAQTVRFYQDVLGFQLIMAVPEEQDVMEQQLSPQKQYVYALLSKDNVELMIQRTDSFLEDVRLTTQDSIGASVSFYMEVEGIDEFYQHIKTKNTTITDIKTAWYGMREFYLRDNNGYVLAIGEKLDEGRA